MPMEATPLEQEVDAVALKETLPLTVLLLVGLLTVTPANAEIAEHRTRMESVLKTCIFIRVISPVGFFGDPVRPFLTRGSTDEGGDTLERARSARHAWDGSLGESGNLQPCTF